MSDDAAFLRAIIAAPADDRPRLIYADYLDERGDPRGELIRVQVELVKPFACAVSAVRPCPECTGHSRLSGDPPPDPACVRREALRNREQELLQTDPRPPMMSDIDGNWRHWSPREVLPFAPVFRRGFVEQITCTWPDCSAHLDAIRQRTPLREVLLTTWPDRIMAAIQNGRLVGSTANVVGQMLALQWPGITFVLPGGGDEQAPTRAGRGGLGATAQRPLAGNPVAGAGRGR